MEEEDPEGEAVVGPSGEATTCSSGNTSPVPLILIIIHLYAHTLLFQHIITSPFTIELFFFLTIESTDEGVSRPQMKEEEDIDMLRSWVQVGRFPAHLEEESCRLLIEVSLLFSLFLLMWLSTSLYIPTPVFSFIFQGWIY